MMILESGSVAKDRIIKDDIIRTFNTVIEIVNFLKSENLISEEPQFNLGSTKLAFRIFKKHTNQVVDDIDNDELNKAELKRLEDGFGDLDVDIVLSPNVTLDDVDTKINEKFGEKIWRAAPKGERAPGQLHFGFKIGDKVHQVDFVELRSKEDRKVREYFSGSSITDEAYGIKGLFNKEMHYALTHIVSPEKVIQSFAQREGKTFEDKSTEYDTKEKQEIETFKKELKEEKISKNYIVLVGGKKYPVIGSAKGKLKLGSEITDETNIDLTPSMDVDANQASFIIVPKRKVSLIESKLQETYGLTYRLYLYRQKFKEEQGKVRASKETSPKKVLLDYIPISEQDAVIKVLLGEKATSKQLFSAVETAKFIGANFADDEKIEFWDAFVEQALEKRNKARIDRKTGQPVIDPETKKPETVGQVSEEKYDATMRKLGELIGVDKLLGKDFYVHPKTESPDAQKELKENYKNLVFNEQESIRQGIGRFDGTGKLPGDAFLKALKALYPHIKDDGILHANSAPNIDIVEKVDSSFCHFGINQNGKFFLASNNSGEVTEDNFEAKFKNNPDFLESFRFLKDHKLLHVVLKNISKEIGKPVKFEAEILPLLTYQPDETGGVTFIGTKYNKQKLGEKGAFVIFKAQVFEGEQWSKVSSATQKKLISDIVDADSKDWKILTNDVHMKIDQDVNFGINFKDNNLEKYFATDAGFKQLQDLMDSKITDTKRKVKEALNEVRAKMQAALDNLANTASSAIGNDNLEGVVLRIKDENGDVMEIKGTSEQFTQTKDKLWKHRNQLEELFDSFKGAIKTQVLQLKITTDRAINQLFLDTVQEFKPTARSKEEAIDEFLVNVINKIINPKADFSDVRGTAKKVVKEYKSSINNLKADFKANQETFDVNSARKTKEAFGIYEEKFTNLFNILLGETENDLQYVISCFKEIYEGKAKNLLDSIKPNTEVQTKKCALWVGRAQPWHKGHDQMIKIGLESAECVFIVIVKGAESSQDENKNPMSTETQKEVIRALYPEDKTSVIVCDNTPSKVSLPFIMMELEKKGLEAVSWLVGEDRKEAYKGEIVRFNYAQWLQGHKYAPIAPSIEFKVTPRVASATDAREMARNSEFIEWVNVFAPSGLSNEAKKAYKKAYNEIRGSVETEMKTKILEFFNFGEAKKDKKIKKDDGTTPVDKETLNSINVKSTDQEVISDVQLQPSETQGTSGNSFFPDTKVPEKKALSKDEIIREFRPFVNKFTHKDGLNIAIFTETLESLEESDFAKTISTPLLNHLMLIIKNVTSGIIGEIPLTEETSQLTEDEKAFIRVSFAELVGPLALYNKKFIENPQKATEVIAKIGFNWNDATHIRIPSSESNRLYDSVLSSPVDGKFILISSKYKKGAAANIGSFKNQYMDLRSRKNLDQSWTKFYNLNNTQVTPMQLFDHMFNLHLDSKETPLILDLKEGAAKSSERNIAISSAVNLATFAIDGFDDSTKAELYQVFDFVRAANYAKVNIDDKRVENKYSLMLNKLKSLTSKIKQTPEQTDLVNTLTNINLSIQDIPTFFLAINKFVGHLAYTSVNIINNNEIARPISDIIRRALSDASVMQLSCTNYKGNGILSYKIIHPIDLGEGLIKLNADHNYLLKNKNYVPNGSIAFELPSK